MSQAWYQYPLINDYGSPDRYGGFPKPDMNIDVPDGEAVTSIFSGVVTGINNPDGSTPDFGNVITIKMDTPWNSVATHEAYLHLKSIAPDLKVGDRVSAGQIIGYSGGIDPGPGLQSASVGFAFYNGDYYGFGPSWSQYLGSKELDPTSLFDQLQSGKLNPTNSSGGIQDILSSLGLPDAQSVKNFFEQFSIIVVGLVLLLVGIIVMFFSSDRGKEVAEKGAEVALL